MKITQEDVELLLKKDTSPRLVELMQKYRGLTPDSESENTAYRILKEKPLQVVNFLLNVIDELEKGE